MKQNRRKRFAAAAAAGLLAAAVSVTAVLSRATTAEAAETFLGIEKLREEVAGSDREYTILEIVPDRAAAEIGFLFDGYEPVLSSWDEETMEWKSWRENLCGLPTFEERKNYIEALKIKLQEYYEKQGMGKQVPVKYFEEAYEESETAEKGFEKIAADGVEKTGWFTKGNIPEGAERYQLSFLYMGKFPQNYEEEEGYLYYTIEGTPIPITDENKDSVAADAYVYKQEAEGVFSIAGTWEQINTSDLEETEPETEGNAEEPSEPEESTAEETTEETTESETATESEGATEETTTEPEETTEEESPSESESASESESSSQPENGSKPESASQPESSSQPEGVSEPESPSQPERTSEPESNSQPESAEEPEKSSQTVSNAEEPESPFREKSTDTASAALNIRWQRLSADIPVAGSDSSEQKQSESSTGEEKETGGSESQKQPESPEQPESSEQPGTEPESGTEEEPESGEKDSKEEETSETENESQESTEQETGGQETETAEPNKLMNEADAGEGTYYLLSFKRVENYEFLPNGTAIYIVQNIDKSTNGEYTFVESADENENKQTYVFNGITIYCKNAFKNNEWFKKNALDMDAADYKDFSVKVLTLTPKELSEMEELPKFDFLYLNSGERVTEAGDTETKEPETETQENTETQEAGTQTDTETPENAETQTDTETPAQTVNGYDAEGMDLTPELTKRLFERIAAGAIPCLVDGGILYETNAEGVLTVREGYQEKQIFRLAAMLCQQDLEQWYDANKGNMAGVSVTKLLEVFSEDADKNFATGQVYCRLKENSIVNSDFAAATIYKTGEEMEQGFQKVLDEIELENLYREADRTDSGESRQLLSTDISQARVLRHIINYKNRRNVEPKKEIRVLEIQPALTTTAELDLEQIQKWAPGVEKVETTIMTTAEFIGKLEKLNENYDLIYIGSSLEHMNLKYWTAEQKNPTTAYNDTDMEGLIYYNVGDLRVAAMSLAGQLDTEYQGNNRNNLPYYYNFVRYGGNDITAEKAEALESFLEGSYPIVVADDFMKQPAAVFADAEFAGCRVNLTEGSYTLEDLKALGIKEKDISSLKVKKGYQVTVYSENNFAGEGTTFTADVSSLKNQPLTEGSEENWDERIVSLTVSKIEGTTPAREVDADHIDNCTYLYEFVEGALKENYTNFYAWSDIEENSELFKFFLNRPKANLTQFTANGTTEEGSEIHYITQGANGRYTLQYHFVIENEGAASMETAYQCKFYIDVNSDGKYSEQEEISDIQILENGAQISSKDLRAGREYTLVREVPLGYKGLLPWRIEVSQTNNKNIYTSRSGYTKLKGLEKEKLKVLQICRDKITAVDWMGGNSEVLFDLGKRIQTPGDMFNVLVYGGTYGGVTYKGIADDFEIDVTFKTISEFEKEFKNNQEYLNNFNMLILGFSDIYGDISVEKQNGVSPMDAIIAFIDSGKSVLFAHDTTSFFNYPKQAGAGSPSYGAAYPWRNNFRERRSCGDYHNAYSLNTYVRGLAGMDRYGILDSGILRQGNVLKQGSSEYNSVVSTGKEVAYKPKSGKKETVPEVQGYTYLIINAKDQKTQQENRYAANEFNQWNLRNDCDSLGNSQWEYANTYNNSAKVWTFTNQYTNFRYDTVYYKGNVSDMGEVVSPYNGEIDNMNVTQVNEGQITEYPYKLQEEFQVSETHAQYYQLDYTADADKDGQSDLVVWYCLGSRKYGDSTQQTVYSQSPNDVRNNYYIYNKGNITYTGMGHRANQCTLEEAKLFINTMIASYQAGIKQPYITVLEKGVPESPTLRTMYRYYDEANGISLNDESTVEDSEKVYFTVQDVNFVKGSRNIMSHVYAQDAGGSETISVEGTEIKVNRLEDRMYNAQTGEAVDANNLESGGIYYILVPKEVMKECDTGLNLYFEAQSIITTNSRTYTTDKVYAKLEVLKAYLFDLD